MARSPSRLLTIVGARPQFIKAAVTSRAIARAGIDESVVLTSQHVDTNMSGVFIDELRMARPAHVLERSAGSGDAARDAMQRRLELLVRAEAPDAVLVYGDTDSTLAGARAAHARAVPLVHVEAGLRSFNPAMREEANRIETDHLSDLLFAPSDSARERLLFEGVPASRVRVSGDVMLDLFAQVAAELGVPPHAPRARPRVLFTAHRAENVDDRARLEVLVDALDAIAERADVDWPVHPRTRRRLADFGLAARLAATRVSVCEPLGYRETVARILACDVVCTDSGGVQKEAFFGKRPCVTIRDETEWTELVGAGWNRLCPLEDAGMVADTVLDAVGGRGAAITPYGDGRASQRVAQALVGWFGRTAVEPDRAAQTA